MHRAEARRVADGRLKQVAEFRRPTDHQLAHHDAARFGQPRMDGVLDGADTFALCNRKLQHVLARRDAGARRVLQRRRDAVCNRLEPRVGGSAVGDAPVLIGDDVAERNNPR